jgi:hypothetical protein
MHISCIRFDGDAQIMHATRSNVSYARSTTRDKVSNGRLLGTHVDLRSAAGRRFRYLVASYADELGGELSEAERSLVRQAVTLQMQAERMQEAVVRGEAIDSDVLIRLSSTSKRLLGVIAGKTGKRAEAPGSELEAYLAEHYGQAADDDGTADQEADAAEPVGAPVPEATNLP